MIYNAIDARSNRRYSQSENLHYLVASCWLTQWGIYRHWAKKEAVEYSQITGKIENPKFVIEMHKVKSGVQSHPCLTLYAGMWILPMIIFPDTKLSMVNEAFNARLNTLKNQGIILDTKKQDKAA